MKVLIAGGGTGGHIMPALAVAHALRRRDPGGNVLLVGRRGGREEQLVPGAGFDLETVEVRGLDRDRPLRNLALPLVLPRAIWQGRRIVQSFRPDVVLGVGGFVMAPGVAGARLCSVPYVLHEQNPTPGLANRMFSAGAAAVCISWAGTALGGRRVVLTGLPLRSEVQPASPRVPPRTLLVTGGSQGARSINEAVWASLPKLLERFDEVIHLVGRQGIETATVHRRAGYTPLEFATDLPALMARSDLAITRGGLSTIAELTATGLPVIVIPGTFGGGHQELNVRGLVDAGAAVRLGDAELSGPSLLATLDALTAERLVTMAQASAAMGRTDAADRVVDVLTEVAG